MSHPFSRGSVNITGKDGKAQPSIDPQYLQSRVDVEILFVGLRVADEMFGTNPLADRVKARVFPSPDTDMSDPAQRAHYLCEHRNGVPSMWDRGFGTGGRRGIEGFKRRAFESRRC